MSLISINGHVIRRNATKGTEDPPVRIARTPGGKPDYASEVAILDDSGNEVARLVYSPHDPIMKCGARLVLKTNNDVMVLR